MELDVKVIYGKNFAKKFPYYIFLMLTNGGSADTLHASLLQCAQNCVGYSGLIADPQGKFNQ